MSILIKGMKMPKSCNACMFDVYGLCLINKNIEGKDELTHSCPLVPVPPHGRLIDGDVAEAIYFTDEDANGKDFYDGILYSADFISKQPTIIPAEEDE